MIRPITFIDTSTFAARFKIQFSDRMVNGLLPLREIGESGEAEDLPILKEWKSARALLLRYKATAAQLLPDQPIVFGKAWIETLPGPAGTPWEIHDDEYAQTHLRTRTCLIPTPDNYTYSGRECVNLGVGVVNLIDMNILHCEVNLSPYPRTHLIVDVQRPDVLDLPADG